VSLSEPRRQGATPPVFNLRCTLLIRRFNLAYQAPRTVGQLLIPTRYLFLVLHSTPNRLYQAAGGVVDGVLFSAPSAVPMKTTSMAANLFVVLATFNYPLGKQRPMSIRSSCRKYLSSLGRAEEAKCRSKHGCEEDSEPKSFRGALSAVENKDGQDGQSRRYDERNHVAGGVDPVIIIAPHAR
jgi:hypothetical protein